MWDRNGTSNFTVEYCRDSCHGEVCKACPRPRLLRDAAPGAAAYIAVSTQWDYSPMGRRTGLRYGDCLPMLARQVRRWAREDGVTVRLDDVVDQVQVIERAIIGAEVERAAQRDDR